MTTWSNMPRPYDWGPRRPKPSCDALRATICNIPPIKPLWNSARRGGTIFLWRYLRLLELRREIQEGLNVVENWNSANDFILIGKGGDIAAHRQEDQEVMMLALHLLQNAMVYINTLMMQRVLGGTVMVGKDGAGRFPRPVIVNLLIISTLTASLS